MSFAEKHSVGEVAVTCPLPTPLTLFLVNKEEGATLLGPSPPHSPGALR